MAFRELIDEMDITILDELGDVARINGREVLGYFSAPWLQPQFGKLNTGLREPRFDVRVSETDGLEPGMLVSVDLPLLDGGGDYDLIQLEPSGDGMVALILRMRA